MKATDESINPECCSEDRGSLNSPLLNSSAKHHCGNGLHHLLSRVLVFWTEMLPVLYHYYLY
jgi:hypothetical protein